MGLIFLAFFLAIAQTNLNQSPQSPPTQSWQVAANRDCSYESVSPQSQKVSTILSERQVQFRIDPPPNPPYVSYAPTFPRTGHTDDQRFREEIYKPVYSGQKWVLVKRDARIEKGKVFGGADQSIAGREMDVIGRVKENGVLKWMFAGLGHCDLNNNEGCWDPLTKVTLYVLQEKGGDGNPPRYPGIDNDDGVPKSPQYPNYWVFNVYLSEKLLIDNHNNPDNNYSSDDLPCWLTQCLPGDYKLAAHEDPNYHVEEWNAPCQQGTPPPALVTVTINPRPTIEAQSLTPGEPYPPSFIKAGPGAADSWFTDVHPDPAIPIPGPNQSVPEYQWFYGKTSGPGTQPYGKMQGRLGNKEVEFTVSLKRLGTAGSNDIGVVLSSGGNHYLYVPTDFSNATQGENLKLRTFKPTVGYVYEWWYPSCKPVIYLYPEKETAFAVSLKPFGIITKSIPSYPWLTGWKNISAKPDGELTYQGKTYDSLYFEGRTLFVKVPQEGFTIRGVELAQFFDIILPKLGLNGKEITDFKTYWLARLKNDDTYYFIGILPREEIDRVEGLNINPSPDTLIRVRLFFKKLASYEFSPLPDLPRVPERSGTTIVDWGGFFKN